jgi:hypothetical protein
MLNECLRAGFQLLHLLPHRRAVLLHEIDDLADVLHVIAALRLLLVALAGWWERPAAGGRRVSD